ncbi:(E)-4-hydroxy-3-methylbut-2-enyl-diphosphate synthase, partial [Candidatus Hakubella thermalkaliphila]
GVWVCG